MALSRFMNLQSCEDPIFDSFTNGEHMEVNSIEMSYSKTGAPHACVSTNDFQVQRIDLTTLETTATFPTEWFVNVNITGSDFALFLEWYDKTYPPVVPLGVAASNVTSSAATTALPSFVPTTVASSPLPLT
ncbi:hypothetical protein BGZ58_004825, partial [Dissophora ornata]